tara:strand:- start:369 stop:623 length:255 start_codon:yes stop_codon:yes gene_type:complete
MINTKSTWDKFHYCYLTKKSTFHKGDKLHNNVGYAKKDANTNIEEYYLNGVKIGYSHLIDDEIEYFIGSVKATKDELFEIIGNN